MSARTSMCVFSSYSHLITCYRSYFYSSFCVKCSVAWITPPLLESPYTFSHDPLSYCNCFLSCTHDLKCFPVTVLKRIYLSFFFLVSLSYRQSFFKIIIITPSLLTITCPFSFSDSFIFFLFFLCLAIPTASSLIFLLFLIEKKKRKTNDIDRVENLRV